MKLPLVWAGVFATVLAAPTAFATAPVEAPRGLDAHDPARAVERGFARMSAGGDFDSFLAEMEEFVPGPAPDPTPVRRVVENYLAKSGAPQRAEPICVESAGPSFQRLHYLQGYRTSPLIWSLTFRKTSDGWRLMNLHVTGNVVERRDLYAYASNPSSPAEEPLRRVETFASQIGTDDRAALEGIYNLDKLSSDDATSFRNLIGNIVSGRRGLGWTHEGIELARAQALSPSMVRFVYVEHSPKDYFVWEFVFYRGAEEWGLISSNVGTASGGGQNILFPGSPINPADASESRRR